MFSKDQLRQEIRKQKRAMSLNDIQKKSNDIVECLKQTEEWKRNDVIYSYVSYNQEVDTKSAMNSWIDEGKKIAVPKVVEGDIKFFFITDMSGLHSGYQGILEPEEQNCADGEAGLMLFPGLAFDLQMHRMGYGGGFYDRYLERWENVKIDKIALAYDYQVFEEIPTEEHDRCMDKIITECREIGKE